MSKKCGCGCSCGKEPQGLGKAEVFKLEKLVEYGAGAVVSRTLQETAGGTVTAFAFDEGQGLSEHSAPFDAIVQVFDGNAEIKIKGEPHLLTQGEIIIMPANVPHAVRAVTRFKMLLTMLRQSCD